MVPQTIRFFNLATHGRRQRRAHKQTGIFGVQVCNVRLSVFLFKGDADFFIVRFIFSLAVAKKFVMIRGTQTPQMSQFGVNMPPHVRRLCETTATRQTLELR